MSINIAGKADGPFPPRLQAFYALDTGSSRAEPSNWNHEGEIHFRTYPKIYFFAADSLSLLQNSSGVIFLYASSGSTVENVSITF